MAKASSWQTKAISIHAPREGCDVQLQTNKYVIIDFNPRTP